ncbi:hypothetical protein BZA05DRAFT_449376 [Tricharina praecox]|uniref:uncharacterized protein n=1 Tax=Tricharina praecox TaxID=43433 RepID=UPI00221E40F8|nr:uncharacterized protein BZA05DRAFT_449376 [Tricharina praecox]KAI5842013.1 hypothetical protein BZA05DRAFT_449376 [Tricharina praecox]
MSGSTSSEADLLETYQKLVWQAQQQPELLRMGGVNFIWLCEQRWQQLEQLRHPQAEVCMFATLEEGRVWLQEIGQRLEEAHMASL